MLKLVFSYLPILLLIYLMVRKNSMPSSRALPLTALLTYLIMIFIFKQDLVLIHATVLKGLLVAWTPILIIGGAILLFRTMEATGSLTVIKGWLNGISSNGVAQLMIVGWAFSFLIEGASGFGTPAAIAAPILVGLGFPPVRVAILALIMNTVPVPFGAVGTPTWFGFSSLGLSHGDLLAIGLKSAAFNTIAAFVIVPLALMFVVKPKSVLKNWLFILLSILGTVGPFLALAHVSYEFPSLVGGSIGLLITVFLAGKGIGLSKEPVDMRETVQTQHLLHDQLIQPDNKSLSLATFPLWGTILMLVLTRIPQFGLKGFLTAATPALHLPLGIVGDLRISPALVIGLDGIFGTSVGWEHALLYVPSLLPFILISLLTLWLYRDKAKTRSVFAETVHKMKDPTFALLGALVFVNLMMMGDDTSAVSLIGRHLAELTGGFWAYSAQLLGAVGTFFSGSNTISNLTFGGIQNAIASDLALNRSTLLAMQSVGGAMGNMICINNIVAVASVLSLVKIEGYILKRTILALLVYALIIGIVAVVI